MDAFVHNFEAFCVDSYHPMADGIALEGMRLIKDNLKDAYENGQNITARTHMLSASMMGATSFQKGLGAVHALAHPLGAIYDKHHGLLNAILLPYVMKENASFISEKMDRLSSFLNTDKPGFEGVYEWVIQIREQLRIPHSLADIGIPAEDEYDIGTRAFQDPSASGNPVPLKPEQYRKILENAIAGNLSDRTKIAA
jgi:alcohol dehydrogenase class IV